MTVTLSDKDLLDLQALDSPARKAQMIAYNLREPNDGEVALDTPEEKPVICLGCGTLYQSLEDRMLRRPGTSGCEGCVHKQKVGMK